GMDGAVVADVVAVVEARRGIERQQPNGVDAEIGDIVELRNQPRKVADPVVVGIEERLHVYLIDQRVFVPERVLGSRRGTLLGGSGSVDYRNIHGVPHAMGAMRQSAKGRSAGSSRTRCSLPVHTKR